MMKRILLLAQYGFVLAACSPTEPEISQLAELRGHQERWQEQQPTNYEYVLQRVCECEPSESGPLRITVREGQIRSAVNAQTDEVVAVDAEQVKSIEDLFVLLEEALPIAYRVTAEYDATLGYPTSIFIDFQRDMVDEEMSFTVRELQAGH